MARPETIAEKHIVGASEKIELAHAPCGVLPSTMFWLFKKQNRSTMAQPPTKVARLTYPFQIVLLVENLEEMNQEEEDLYSEILTETAKYDIPVTVREYDLFHPDDSEYVRYLPSYHIYSKSRLKSTHSMSGNVRKRLDHWIQKFEARFNRS